MDLHGVTALEPAGRVLDGAVPPLAGDVWLAGGTWLFSEPQPGARRLLDLGGLGWEPVVLDDDGDLRVAATCTVQQLTAWTGAPPLVAQCADAFLAGWKVQGVATVGGNLVTALPAAPMVSLLAALDGVAELWTPPAAPGAEPARRHLPVAELVTGDRTTALAPGELVREVVVPRAHLAARTAFRRATLTPLGRSASLVVGRLDAPEHGGQLVVTVTAATRAPLQLRWPSPSSLAEQGGPDAAAAAVDAAVDGSQPRRTWHDDVHGHPAWRRAMALAQVREVVRELLA
ncbi:FAD-binding molybdopterin dehydrogenase [Streptomyces sp. NP160]|uniref:FAD binding domain-containing protein n=1 Tax=Streptomyces sp. NP160 TaxID=2586637 RepID=UPI00111B3760|nr:FAD binding domain-containing protein [Streptomyces sp. NP160]TNM61544.1 FAD-binding molybdopterin dehydrogenase [Streptomyces sp. NP160]